jgi:hypothetical protein
MAFGVPVLLYGAVELGWMHPIQTPKLERALSMMNSVCFIAAVYLVGNLRYGWQVWHSDPKEKSDSPMV